MEKIIKYMLVLFIVTGSFLFSVSNVSAETSDAEAGEMMDPNKEMTYMNEDGTVVKEEERTNAIEGKDIKEEEEIANARSRESGITSSSVAVVNFRTKSSSAINTNYTEENTGRSGYVNGYYAADAAFLGFDNDKNPTKVKFLQAGVVGWVSYSDVSVVNYSSSALQTTSKYYVKGGRLYHGIVTNISNSSYSSSVDCGPKPSYLTEGNTYFSYDGHYFYNYNNGNSGYKTMLTDYRNNVRTHAVNASNPYYNYYQYLSHRSQTTYTAAQLNSAIANFCSASEKSYGRTSKMKNLGSVFIENQNKYGANALLMIGVAANESAWGCSSIAANKNNLFGHAAYDSDPNGSSNAYSSVNYSIYYHAARYVSKGYCDSITDSRYYGAFLGDKASGMAVNYASDPYWGEKAAAVAWRIDTYLGGSDSYKYTIGIKDTLPTNHTVINIKSSASSSSTTLYSTYPVSSKTTYKSYAPSNYAFIVLKGGTTNGYYKIQTDSEVNSSRTKIVVQEEYSFSNSYGYIPSNSIKIVSNGKNSTSVDTTSSVSATSISLNKTSLSLIVGNSSTLTATVSPSNTSNKTVTWTSSNTSVATVTSSGTVKGVKAGTATITAKTSNGKTATCKVTVSSKTPTVSYQTHVQNIGWQSSVSNGATAGTSGKSLRLEGIKISLGNADGSIQYRTHVQNIGWQGWKTNGSLSGTSGKSLRLEAIQIKLTGNTANEYDVYYRVHCQNIGWMGWAKNGQSAGTAGYSYRLEAIQIKLVKKGSAAPGSTSNHYKQHYIGYSTHVQNIGWQSTVYDGNTAGTTGKSLRLEGIKISLSNQPYSGSIQYKTHVQNIGWQGWKTNGAISGTSGRSLRLEAIQIKLTGEMAEQYDVYYRVHCQNFGWMGWAKNGQSAGSAGYSYRLEGIQIKLVKKGSAAPGSTANRFKSK